jgi:hypothetical protein
VKPTTPTMRGALALAHFRWGDKFTRYPGGYWCGPDFDTARAVGTSTVAGLVQRGLAVYDEFQDGRNGRFPVTALLTFTGIALASS